MAVTAATAFIIQVGDAIAPILVIRGAAAGGADLILRYAPNADITLGADPLTVNQLYIGAKARFTALSNGVRLEVQNTSGTWIKQNEWTEP